MSKPTGLMRLAGVRKVFRDEQVETHALTNVQEIDRGDYRASTW